MQKICSGLSTFGFISERQTLVCLFLFTAGIPFLHTFQPGEDKIGLVLTTSFPQSSTLVPTLQSWADQLQSNPTDLELWKNTWPQLCSVSLCLSKAPGCQLCESQLPGQQHELKNGTENQKLAYSHLPVSKFSWISVQPAQEASSLHIQLTPPQLAKWLEYLLANSCVLVGNIQIITFAVCLKVEQCQLEGRYELGLSSLPSGHPSPNGTALLSERAGGHPSLPGEGTCDSPSCVTARVSGCTGHVCALCWLQGGERQSWACLTCPASP